MCKESYADNDGSSLVASCGFLARTNTKLAKLGLHIDLANLEHISILKDSTFKKYLAKNPNNS